LQTPNLREGSTRALLHATPQATASKATGAEAPVFATEGHQMAFAASVASHLREAMREKASGQELL